MGKHKKHPHHSHHHAHDRRGQFASQPPGRRDFSPTTLVLGVCALFAAVLAYLVISGNRTGAAAIPVTEVADAGSDVRLPLAMFADGVARFYRYTTADGRDVRFFVMKSSDGIVRAAFDACDTCYRERRGYRQRGDLMVCNNCGRTFRSVDINVLQGGCNPAPLERIVEGDEVVLKATAIAFGASYF